MEGAFGKETFVFAIYVGAKGQKAYKYLNIYIIIIVVNIRILIGVQLVCCLMEPTGKSVNEGEQVGADLQ